MNMASIFPPDNARIMIDHRAYRLRLTDGCIKNIRCRIMSDKMQSFNPSKAKMSHVVTDINRMIADI
jgi:hypothetical protein